MGGHSTLFAYVEIQPVARRGVVCQVLLLVLCCWQNSDGSSRWICIYFAHKHISFRVQEPEGEGRHYIELEQWAKKLVHGNRCCVWVTRANSAQVNDLNVILTWGNCKLDWRGRVNPNVCPASCLLQTVEDPVLFFCSDKWQGAKELFPVHSHFCFNCSIVLALCHYPSTHEYSTAYSIISINKLRK